MSKKLLGQILSGSFLLIGVLGFIMDPVLGIFEVDMMHNIVHLLTGGLGLFLSMKSDEGAATYGKIVTVMYGLVTVLGFLVGEGQLLGVMEINGADNLLHLALTAAHAYLGFAPSLTHQSAA